MAMASSLRRVLGGGLNNNPLRRNFNTFPFLTDRQRASGRLRTLPGVGGPVADEKMEHLMHKPPSLTESHNSASSAPISDKTYVYHHPPDNDFFELKERYIRIQEKLTALEKKLNESKRKFSHKFGKERGILGKEIDDINLEKEIDDIDRETVYWLLKSNYLLRIICDVRLIDVYRTGLKHEEEFGCTAILACGDYDCIVGYATAYCKGGDASDALGKAYHACFANTIRVKQRTHHTVARATQATCKGTTVYLWPAPTGTGIEEGTIVATILNLAGFDNVKYEVVGQSSRRNTVEALFKALRKQAINVKLICR